MPNVKISLIKISNTNIFTFFLCASLLIGAKSAYALSPEKLAKRISDNQQGFSQCLAELKTKARDAGVSQARIESEIPKLKFVKRVIELDSSQPEFVTTFPDYFSRRVNDWRINKGRALLKDHKEFLRSLTLKYGIPSHYLLAFWGLETNYGGYKGKMSTLDSLATLACDYRRSEYFTKELLLVLKLMDREGLEKDKMQGSWAGAMGHTQFMPTAYTNYAIDGDGDKKIDLWNSEKDALASAAHFLWKLGWKPGLRWGREVRLPDGFDYTLANKNYRPLMEWAELGITKADGSGLGTVDIAGKLLVPAGHEGPAFIAYHNFKVILRWNNSEFYGVAVGQLATQIAGGVGLSKPLPELPKYSIAEMANMQRALNSIGIDVGGADGIIGSATRAGIREFQAQNNMIADGFPSPQTLEAILSASTR